MAQQKSGGQKKMSLIDPLYQKFSKSIIRALGSTDFYEFFMEAIAGADNQIQFSNRKAIKTVDLDWVDAVEEALPAFQNIISNPRNVIHEEELIVNVANAKKAGSDVVRHLAQHASLVEDFNERNGDVRPSRLMQKYREDSTGLYENRLVFTTMEMAFQFVKIRHDALFSAMSDEFGAKLRVDSTMESATEQVHMETFMHIKEIEGALETDDKNRDVFDRISRMYRVLSVYMNSTFSQQMSKLNRVKGTITKTNVLKKNPNYNKIMRLLEFLHSYEDIGYTIRVVEQNPQVDERLQQDIFHRHYRVRCFGGFRFGGLRCFGGDRSNCLVHFHSHFRRGGDHRLFRTTAGRHGQYHCQCQNQANHSFHRGFLLKSQIFPAFWLHHSTFRLKMQ